MDVTGDDLIDLATTALDSFRAFDEDGNGTVTAKELSFVLVELNPKAFTEEKVEVLFDSMDRNNDDVIEYHEFIHWLLGSGKGDKIMLSKVVELQEDKKEAIRRKAREDVIAKRKALEEEQARKAREGQEKLQAIKEAERLVKEAEAEEARKEREAQEQAEEEARQARIAASKVEAKALEKQWEASNAQFLQLVYDNKGQFEIVPKDATKATQYLRKLQKSEEPWKLLQSSFPVPLVETSYSDGTEVSWVSESGVLALHNKSSGLADIQEDGSLKVSTPSHYQAKGKISKVEFEGDVWTIHAKGTVISTQEDGVNYTLQKAVAFTKTFVNSSPGAPDDEAAMSLWCTCKEAIGVDFLHEDVNEDAASTSSPGLTHEDVFVKMRVAKYPLAK